jgi:hypothetical protein
MRVLVKWTGLTDRRDFQEMFSWLFDLQIFHTPSVNSGNANTTMNTQVSVP